MRRRRGPQGPSDGGAPAILRSDLKPEVDQIIARASRRSDPVTRPASMRPSGRAPLASKPQSRSRRRSHCRCPSFEARRSKASFSASCCSGPFHQAKRLAHDLARRAVTDGRDLVLDEIRQLLQERYVHVRVAGTHRTYLSGRSGLRLRRVCCGFRLADGPIIRRPPPTAHSAGRAVAKRRD